MANKRWSPPYRRAKAIVSETSFGELALWSGKFNLGYDYVDLLEEGTIHLLDLARFFMGDVVAVNAMEARNSNRSPSSVENVVLSLRFQSGTIGSLHTSKTALSLKPWERVEIYGIGRWLAVEDQSDLLFYNSEAGPAQSWSPVVPNTLLFDEEFGGYMGEIENFLQVIRGEEKPSVTGWDGHRAYELVVATHLSLQTGEMVKLPLDPTVEKESVLAS
jgi:predicted dehydrogenase